MPWCPVCKNEYREGFTKCTDCEADLVDSLKEEMKPIYFGEEDTLNILDDFLKANNISGYRIEKEDDQSVLYTDDEHAHQILACLHVFLKDIVNKDSDINEQEDSESVEPEVVTKVYTSAEKRAEEYKSGAFVLIFVGIIGAAALVILDLGILPIGFNLSNNILMNVVMGTLFGAFIVMGISSVASYKRLKMQASIDNDISAQITSDVTAKGKEYFSISDSSEDSEEVLYFKRTDIIRSYIDSSYSDIDESLKEHLIEEIYNELF